MEDDSVALVSGLRLVDIEGLRATVAEGAAHLSEDIAAAKGIVEDEVRRFAVRERSERLAPLIRALRERGEEVRAAELSRFGSQLSGLSPAEWEAVEALARGIVAKLLHDPIVRLKEPSGPGNDATYARVFGGAVRHRATPRVKLRIGTRRYDSGGD
jgi:glutamyl-tRNA reductase